MPATIKRSAQNSNVYGAYGIVSSDKPKLVPLARKYLPVCGELLILGKSVIRHTQAAHRISCGSGYYHAVRGRRKQHSALGARRGVIEQRYSAAPHSRFVPAWQPDPGGVCHPVTFWNPCRGRAERTYARAQARPYTGTTAPDVTRQPSEHR